MTKDKPDRRWALIIIGLAIIIVIGSAFAWLRYRQSLPAEISITQPEKYEQLHQIYVGGAVNNPGFYPLNPDDRIKPGKYLSH